MRYSQSNGPEQLECPVRHKVISSMICHTCPNHIRVLYKSETPAELQCSRWTWSNEDEQLGSWRTLDAESEEKA